ncbi:adenylate/guanylate cyclase domain-containing protein [Sphingosinicella sp. CPCC 101087]|uniref:adenylate/guanylate cyclase domain-containing protein n=1 Tax=Sphingosinicella sp. CPCC 101087 TaxID=2497754 RepID=UPI00101C570B|nr:adenylate/guanylate cyclase domain-containing protein [Sphingosinicella sp. CPCC 101087]
MAEQANGGGWAEGLRRSVRQVGPARLIGTLLFLMLGLYVARFGWEVPFASDVERALYDLRFQTEAHRTLEQDDRIVLVTYNDETLAQLGKRSPLDRAMLARALAAIDGMNPRAIGIDILIDQAQPEDPELVATLRQMRTPIYVAFASAAHNPDQILPWQEEFLTNFLAQAQPGPVRPASIRLLPDLADGVIRRWPDQPADLPPLLANAMAPPSSEFRSYTRAIDFRLPATSEADEVPVFTNLPIQFVAEFPDGVRSAIEGRYVLIGGDIQDLDDYETPMTRFTGRWMKGLEVHAHVLSQLLDGRMPAAIPGWMLWVAAVVAVAAGALTAFLELRGWKLGLALLVQLVFFGYLPFLLQGMAIDTISLPAFGWGAGWLFAFVGVGTAARAVGSEQRRFAQSALGKYLPPDVASQIMRDPSQLALHGEKKQIYALFTDLEGFTKLSHAITPERLSGLLNRYLDLMSDIVLEHGGTIDKFVGDAVVAFWGAPIARADDADRAARAAIGMYEAGQEFARTAGDDIPPIGRTRVGLHLGEAVVGNFGGEGRIQYTALGDAMNTAARLESANKALKTRILVSRQAKEETGLDLFRPMGRVVLSGRATPIEVWEPVPEMDSGLRTRLTDLWQRFDGGDTEALAQLEAIAAGHKEDAAMQEFVYRIGEAGPGGHFVLGSK